VTELRGASAARLGTLPEPQPLPDPLAAEAKVTVHPDEPTLIVRPLEKASYAATLWRKGHRKMTEDGGRAESVWAHTANHRDISRGVPASDGSLRFKFRQGDPVFRELAAADNLAGIFTVDRRVARIWSVKIHGR